MRGSAKESGFTLTEVIVVMAMIQVLLALAVPAFASYVRKSKSSEAVTNLNMLFKQASSYYQRGQTEDQSITSNSMGHCVVGTTALMPATPSSAKQFVDFSSIAEFKALGFDIGSAVYYGYRIISAVPGSGCGQAPGSELYTFLAMGDLDGNNVFSQFELAAGSNQDNELHHSGGFYIVNETE